MVTGTRQRYKEAEGSRMKHMRDIGPMSKYSAKVAFRVSEEGDPIGCDACDYNAPLSVYEEMMPRRLNFFCEICASTRSSAVVQYPALHIDDAGTLKTQAFCTNAILDQMGAFDGMETVVVQTDEDDNYIRVKGQ